jgi:hypothetical protein
MGYQALTLEDCLAVARQAAEQAGVDPTIDKVEDIQEIMKFKVMRTPAVAIDDKVKISGRVLSVEEVKLFLVQA